MIKKITHKEHRQLLSELYKKQGGKWIYQADAYIKQQEKQEKLIQKLKYNLISGHFEDKLEHTNKDDSSKMYNKGLYDMVNAIEEYVLQEFKELEKWT